MAEVNKNAKYVEISLALVGTEPRPSPFDARPWQLTTTQKNSGRSSVELTQYSARIDNQSGEKSLHTELELFRP